MKLSNENTTATAPPTEEQIAELTENFSKLMSPFRIDVEHKDDDGTSGETMFTIAAPTTLGAISCLEQFATFRDTGWKAIVVQELFDEAEADLVNSAEVSRRVTDRVINENSKVFREGVLSFDYTYNHQFLKNPQAEKLTITYKYNQLLHLIQMANTVLTEKFSSGIIEGIMEDLESDTGSSVHNIKL